MITKIKLRIQNTNSKYFYVYSYSNLNINSIIHIPHKKNDYYVEFYIIFSNFFDIVFYDYKYREQNTIIFNLESYKPEFEFLIRNGEIVN